MRVTVPLRTGLDLACGMSCEPVQLATPLAESAGETFTRLAIHDDGLPPPAPQVRVYDGDVAVYRLDLAYESIKVCGVRR